MTVQATVSLAVDSKNVLGEGCVWDEKEGRLYWVDIEGKLIQRWKPGGTAQRWELPERVGTVALRKSGGLVAALASGFAFVNLEPLKIERIAEPEPHLPGNRFNDGRADPGGRLWAGTMDDKHTAFSGSLYRLDPDLSWRRMESGICISNSTTWSPDGRVMYFADSRRGAIWAYDFDVGTGTPSNKRVFATLEEGVAPDGATVDAAGYLWSAQWGGSRVRRYAPDGRVDFDVKVPATETSCCCFGGPGLTTLYVTSARIALPAETLEKEPNAGGVFAVTFDSALGIRGVPEPRFAS
jgi:sugar lactone lactonase YvrE